MTRNATPIDPERQLMIKTKVCQRLIKEVSFYHLEVKENEQKVADMKNNAEDPYDIKRYEQVLGESYMMVPDSTKRLQSALEDLSQFTQDSDVVHKNGEWYKSAIAILNEHFKQEDRDPLAITETNIENLAEGEAF